MALSKIQSESINLADTFAFTGTVSGAGGGKVLQVKSFELKDQFSFSTNETWTDITGLHNCSITKSDATNHVLIEISIGAWDASSGNTRRGLRLRRNSSALFDATTAGSRQVGIMVMTDHSANRPKPVAFSYLDKTGTDTTVTYGIQARHVAGNTYINSSSSDTNNDTYYRGSSTIILTEIEA